MISIPLARRLRERGLVWHPAPGDAFCIDSEEFDGEVFTVSEMTVEAHEFDTGTILGFNGTTEWALDSVALEDALWLPRETQMRERLGAAFCALVRFDGHYEVKVEIEQRLHVFTSMEAPDAYAEALCAILKSVPR